MTPARPRVGTVAMLVLPLILGSTLTASAAVLPSTPAPDPLALAIPAVSQDEIAEEDLGVWRGGLDVGLTKSEGNANNSSDETRASDSTSGTSSKRGVPSTENSCKHSCWMRHFRRGRFLHKA